MDTSPSPHSDKELNWLHVAGKYAELIEAERENLAHQRCIHAFEHQDVGIAISALAWSLYENGDFALAEIELLNGLVADCANRSELQHRNAAFFHDLANIYLATNREQDAAIALGRAKKMLAAMSELPDLRMATSKIYGARILQRRRNYTAAERLIKDAISLATESPWPNYVLGVSYHRLSQVYAAQGKISDAEDVIRMALESYPAWETAYYANSLCLLGLCVAKQGNKPLGQSHLTIALEILKRVRPSGHRDIVAAERRLAAIVAAKGGS
jgi:tetratricopeptide (TPR) repeat protein